MEAKRDICIRTYRPGDPSRVCYFYYKLYEQQYQFNGSVEKYFIKGMGALFDCPHESQLWVAERDGNIVGSIAIVKKGDHAAQLRWFGVSMEVQGMGIGNALLETAMDFCREHHYTDVILWTIDILKPARHLYGKHGFVMTETKPNYEWASYELMEEKWEYHAPQPTGNETRTGMAVDDIYFVRPAMEWKEKALAYRAEHFEHGETVICGSELFDKTESYEQWLSSVTRNADPLTVNPNWVVTDTFFAVRQSDAKIIGMIDLRHTLNAFLKDLGNCGYSVRPTERGKGYATQMLGQLIAVAKAAGMPEFHISVEKENTASVKVIKANGGIYERSFRHEGQQADVYKIIL